MTGAEKAQIRLALEDRDTKLRAVLGHLKMLPLSPSKDNVRNIRDLRAQLADIKTAYDKVKSWN